MTAGAAHFPQTHLPCSCQASTFSQYFRCDDKLASNNNSISYAFFSGSSDEDEIDNLVEDETNILCCQGGRKLPPNSLHPECFPIEIPSNDIFFSKFNQKCMEFVRSMPAERPDCSLGPREQVRMY